MSTKTPSERQILQRLPALPHKLALIFDLSPRMQMASPPALGEGTRGVMLEIGFSIEEVERLTEHTARRAKEIT